jgi:nucleotide-binding universal stress UspA family protein
MKILIAYDGSECSDIALNDLRYAGLPQDAQAIVLTAADTFIPEEEGAGEVNPLIEKYLAKARNHAQEEINKARDASERGSARVSEMFPNWQIAARSQADAPAWAAVTTADQNGTDLIICGSHGYGLFNRARLGSVSEKILNEAKCSVRIAKKGDHAPNDPLRIVLAFDGSEDANLALDELTQRSFAPGSEVHVVSSVDLRMVTAISYMSIFASELREATREEDHELVRRMNDEAVSRLNQAGLRAQSVVLEGDPKKLIIKHAEEWKADTIFAGAHGTTRTERFLMGSVSTALASRAHCTVEIVRENRSRNKSS